MAIQPCTGAYISSLIEKACNPYPNPSLKEAAWYNLFFSRSASMLLSQEQSMRNIIYFLASLHKQDKLIRNFEKAFVTFKKNFFPELNKPNDLDTPKYRHWLYNNEKRLPAALPYPFHETLMRI
jgi:hypothetical protein